MLKNTPSDLSFIPLSAPHLSGREWEYIKDCLDTGWVSSVGSYVNQFEELLARYTSNTYAVATSSGTAALHTALLVAGVQPNDEVLVSNMTFIAPVNAIHYTGAIPVLIDAEPNHWQMDISQVKLFLKDGCERVGSSLCNKQTKRKVVAIIPVHILGHPVDMSPLMSLACEYGLTVIEDATESLGSIYEGKPAGSLAHIGCFSFNGNKIITTGGGGMFVCQREDWALRAKYLTTQAKDDMKEYIHNNVGFNYRLTNIQAAMGCAQMQALPSYVQKRRNINRRYIEELSGLRGISFQKESANAVSNCWLTTICIDEEYSGFNARKLRDNLLKEKIETRPLWQPMHLSAAHVNAFKTPCPVSELLYLQALSLPSSSSLDTASQERIIQHIKDVFNA